MDRSGVIDRNVLDDDVDGDWCTAEWFYDMKVWSYSACSKILTDELHHVVKSNATQLSDDVLSICDTDVRS